MSNPSLELTEKFAALFGGVDDPLRPEAFGTGDGHWIKRQPHVGDFQHHLAGWNPSIGLPPLRQNNTCWFAAIDLDEPDFEAAREMQEFLPGTSWIERSRSGNAHVWVFFSEPIEAWVPMGILKEATVAAGKQHVEVFPKNHDFSRVRYGNYINLPYHGPKRPILAPSANPYEMTIEDFVSEALAGRNIPKDWRKRAGWLLLEPPGSRESTAEFGQQANLHICGEHIIANCELNPVTEGHRAVVFFSLAKMLSNWQLCDHQEALDYMRQVNDASPSPISDSELRRILGNAERGQFTSTGCDDPLMAPYVHPDCKIASR